MDACGAAELAFTLAPSPSNQSICQRVRFKPSAFCLRIRHDIRLWVGDPAISSCRVSLFHAEEDRMKAFLRWLGMEIRYSTRGWVLGAFNAEW